MRCIRIDLSKIFPMEPSELKNSIRVESYDEKTAENDRNCYPVAGLPIRALFVRSTLRVTTERFKFEYLLYTHIIHTYDQNNRTKYIFFSLRNN